MTEALGLKKNILKHINQQKNFHKLAPTLASQRVHRGPSNATVKFCTQRSTKQKLLIVLVRVLDYQGSSRATFTGNTPLLIPQHSARSPSCHRFYRASQGRLPPIDLRSSHSPSMIFKTSQQFVIYQHFSSRVPSSQIRQRSAPTLGSEIYG